MKRLEIALATFAIAAGTASASANTVFKCRDGAQLVAGSYIVTPYCQDKLLAEVARQYGSRISFDEILENPNSKRVVCRLVGRDIRVFENCQTTSPIGRRGF